MLTCSKKYTDIPFAHRQPKHDGHCAFIHGHNWSIHATFACKETDENGFVVDFGKLKYLKEWIAENLDHACVLNTTDEAGHTMVRAYPDLYKLYTMDDCSCEGIAMHIFSVFDNLVRANTNDRAWVHTITIEEDSRNSATYAP